MFKLFNRKKSLGLAQNYLIMLPLPETADSEIFFGGYTKIRLGSSDEDPALAFTSENLAKYFNQMAQAESIIIALDDDVIRKTEIKHIFLFSSEEQIRKHFGRDEEYLKNLEKLVHPVHLAGGKWIVGR